MSVPVVNRTQYQLLDIGDDGFLSLLLPSGETKDDIRLPTDELGEKLKADFEAGKQILVTVLSSMKQELCVEYKESTSD